MPARFHVSQSRWRDAAGPLQTRPKSHRRSHMSASAGAEGREAEARDVIVESVCGQLWGLRHAKLAVLLALIGGVSRRVRAPWPPCRRPPRVPQGGRRLHVGDTRDAFAAAKEGRLRRPLAPQTCTLRRPLRLSPVRRNDCSNDTCVASRVRILKVAAALSPAPPKRRWSVRHLSRYCRSWLRRSRPLHQRPIQPLPFQPSTSAQQPWPGRLHLVL